MGQERSVLPPSGAEAFKRDIPDSDEWFPASIEPTRARREAAAAIAVCTGTVTAGPGVTGTLGTIKRYSGATQAPYNGHSLYTYTADTAPGQANGNGANAFGGLWHEVTPSRAATPAPSSSGGGNGY